MKLSEPGPQPDLALNFNHPSHVRAAEALVQDFAENIQDIRTAMERRRIVQQEAAREKDKKQWGEDLSLGSGPSSGGRS